MAGLVIAFSVCAIVASQAHDITVANNVASAAVAIWMLANVAAASYRVLSYRDRVINADECHERTAMKPPAITLILARANGFAAEHKIYLLGTLGTAAVLCVMYGVFHRKELAGFICVIAAVALALLMIVIKGATWRQPV